MRESGPDVEFSDRVHGAFTRFDEDNRGCLTCEQVKLAFMVLLGQKLTKWDLRRLFPAKEVEGEGSVEWQSFLAAACKRRHEMGSMEEVRQAFKAFDRRCVGFLSLDDVRAAFRSVAPHTQEALVDQIFFQFDEDRDGRLNFAQFERMWKEGA